MDSVRSRTCLGRSSRYVPRLTTLGIQWFRPISSLGIEWPPPVEDIDILHTGSGQPLLSQESTPSFTVQVPTAGVGEEAIFHTSPSLRLPPASSSSPSFPVRRSDAPPFFSPGRSDDGILPTPPFYTLLPSTYSLRRSGSSPTRSGLPEKASSTTVPCSSPSTLGAHPLPFSPLPSPHLSPSSPHQASCPRVSSFSSSPPPLLIVGALVTWAIYTQGQLLL